MLYFQEMYGEDLFFFGELVVIFVKCLQGDDLIYIWVNVGCKYFDVYGGLENIFVFRFFFDVKVRYIS